MSKMIQPDDWYEITGYRIGSKQCQALDEQGINYSKKAGPLPVLSWEAYNRQMCQPVQARENVRIAPNFEVLTSGG